MWMRAAQLALALCLAGLASGCATNGAAGPVSYRESAEQLYLEGVSQIDGGDYMQAIATLEAVRNRFPYSSFAALAELRIADAEFARGRYLSAIDAYGTFIKLHPSHPDVDWAAFRIGESHYEAIPSGFFLFPSPSERDITEVRAARTTLEDFIAAHPESEYVPKARKLHEEVLRILAGHEMAVGDFYASREKWAGAAGRYQRLLDSYPGVGFDAEATFKLVDALREMGERDRAIQALERFLGREPGDGDARRARELMQELSRGE